jgi:hypothetical protein
MAMSIVTEETDFLSRRKAWRAAARVAGEACEDCMMKLLEHTVDRMDRDLQEEMAKEGLAARNGTYTLILEWREGCNETD